MNTKTVYVPVSFRERSPEKEGMYLVKYVHNKGFIPIVFIPNKKWYSLPVAEFWLEKQEMVVITKVDFEARIADAFNTGYEEFKYNMYKDK